MSFVKLNEFWVNVDHIVYVQDIGPRFVVKFRGPSDKDQMVAVEKSSADAGNLMKAITERCE